MSDKLKGNEDLSFDGMWASYLFPIPVLPAEASIKNRQKHVAQSKKAEQTDEIHTRQASAVAFSAADQQSSAQVEGKRGFFSSTRKPEYRPSVSTEWFAVQATRPDKSALQAGWIGLRAEFDVAYLRFPILELGMDANLFRSIAPLNADALGGSATDANLTSYALFKANTAKFGIPMIRIMAGYHGNWRQSSHGVDFLGRVNGFRFGTEISGIVDKTFALGISGAMTTSHRGLFDFGAFISQRLSPQARFGTWSMRFGVNISLLRQEFEDAGLKLENWLTFAGGITAAI